MFGRGIKLFRLFGFEVRMDWSWLIVAMLLTWSLARTVFPSYYMGLPTRTYWWMGALGAVGLFASIVLHEFGHSLVARRFGIPMRGITLFIFGGVAEMGGHPPSPKSEFFTAIAGPLVTVVLVGVFAGLAQLTNQMNWPIELNGVLSYLTWINVVVLLFNLVPAFPLDGGRVLRSLLWAWKKNLRWATRVASVLGTAFAFLLVAFGVFNFFFGNFVSGIWYFLIGMFIRDASKASYQQVLVREFLEGEPVRRFMSENPQAVSPDTSIREIVDNYLYRFGYKTYPVVTDGHLLGCVTMERMKKVPKEQWNTITAENLLEPCSRENTIEPEADAAKALSRMSHTQSGRLMVVDHGRLMGIVAFKDLANFLSRKMELEAA